VATGLAAGGVEARHGEHLLIAETPETFARQVARVLTEPGLAAELATSARRLVEARYTWERSVAQLEAVYRSVAVS
jgi:glycosyltransferase involved in cell wall biosynthesis